ncbi:MAG: hypothetical protein WD749_11215 [Phycisphaerales bacterium]
MSTDALSSSVLTLIAERIDSVAQLEVLLFMRDRRDRAWTGREVAGELRISPTWTEDQLALHTRRALLAREGSAYRYSPPPDVAGAVDDLSAAYQTRPVAVVTAIYTKPDRTIQNFADAFRLRRGQPDEGPPRGEGHG